jgi:hypothetical protein
MRIEAKAALAEILARNGNALEARRLLREASGEANLAPGTLPADAQALLQHVVGLINLT